MAQEKRGGPRGARFRLQISIDISPMAVAVNKANEASIRSGGWPRRPPTQHQMPDGQWRRLQKCFGLPEVASDRDVRALFKHHLMHARLSLAEERRRTLVKIKRAGLTAVATAEAGDPMPNGLHAEILGQIAGMAWLDSSFGRGDLSLVGWCREYVSQQKLVTSQLKHWANLCLVLGAGHRSHDRKQGGGGSLAELVFVSVLINFWIDVLVREPSSWAAGNRHGVIAAAMTRFILTSLHLVGVRAQTRPSTKKLRIDEAHRRKSRRLRSLTLEDVHQRILRVRREMKAAAKIGLEPNYLSRMLNPALTRNTTAGQDRRKAANRGSRSG